MAGENILPAADPSLTPLGFLQPFEAQRSCLPERVFYIAGC